jgi:hypothetical protein
MEGVGCISHLHLDGIIEFSWLKPDLSDSDFKIEIVELS